MADRAGGRWGGIPVEDRTVFLTACGGWADPEIKRCLDGDVHWPSILAVANAQYATSEVWRRLNRLGAQLPEWPSDEEAVEALRRMARILDFQMTTLQERLELLLERLRDEGLDVVLLKGAATGLQRFGDFRYRPMGDVDLLFPADQAERAHRLARDMGWELPRSKLRPDMYEKHHHLIQLERQDGLHASLEVHWDLFPEWGPFRFSGEDILERARPLDPAPAGAPRVPAVEDQLLHACLHFGWSHTFHYGTWRTIRDVDALLDEPDLDLDLFVERTRSARGASCVYWALVVIRRLTGRTLPEGLLETLAHRPRRLVEGVLERHLAREALGRLMPPGIQRLRRVLWSLAIDPSGSGHGPGRPWTGADRWPGPEEAELALPQHQPSTATERARGMAGYLRFLAGGLTSGIKGGG